MGDSWVLANLGLRLLIWGWISWHGYLVFGFDSQKYLSQARAVCSGQWGGVLSHGPIYPWFLCAFSWGSLAWALLFQSLLIFAVGVWLYRKTRSRMLALLWLYDPVLLVYSHLIMTEAFFSVGLLVFAVFLKEILESSQTATPKSYGALGASLGWVILTRSIGMPLGALSFLGLAILACSRRIPARGAMVAGLVCLACLAPREYWNVSRNHVWSIANQGDDFVKVVAGTVANQGRGLEFRAAEDKWLADHPGATNRDALNTLLEHRWTWLLMSAKSVARILLGHLNPELSYLARGKVMAGPGWFKETHGDLSLFEMVFWVSGLAGLAAYCAATYVSFLRWMTRRERRWDLFSIWCLAAALMLVLLPTIYGEARFRSPLWAVMLAAWWWAMKRPSTPTSGSEIPRAVDLALQ